jgi:hypothetical protein
MPSPAAARGRRRSPHSRDGVRRGTTRAGPEQRRAGAREASDAVHAPGLEGFGEVYHRQDGGEPLHQL